MNLVLMSGAGNRFAVLDAIATPLKESPRALAPDSSKPSRSSAAASSANAHELPTARSADTHDAATARSVDAHDAATAWSADTHDPATASSADPRATTTMSPADLPALARAVCATVEPRLDGLLVAAPPVRGGDCAMWVFNADGSRPETCGNGLRCIAKLVRDRGHVTSDAFTIESDAGPCATTVERAGGRVVRARVHMGSPRIVGRDVAIALDGAELRGTLVDMGNPHCVLFVDDERTEPVTTQGPRVEKHALFPRGTNVEYLALRDGRVRLRVWERGVGETQACGSGACAAAVAAVERGVARFPVRLELPGGVLEVDSDGRGGVFLTGPVAEEGTFAWEAGGRRTDGPARRQAPA